MATGLRPMMSVCGLNSRGLNLDEQSVECSLGEIPAALPVVALALHSRNAVRQEVRERGRCPGLVATRRRFAEQTMPISICKIGGSCL